MAIPDTLPGHILLDALEVCLCPKCSSKEILCLAFGECNLLENWQELRAECRACGWSDHPRTLKTHDLSFDSWLDLIYATSPDEYREPPAPRHATDCLPGKDGKMAVMLARVNAKPTNWKDRTDGRCGECGHLLRDARGNKLPGHTLCHDPSRPSLSPWHAHDGDQSECDQLSLPTDPGRNGRLFRKTDWQMLAHHKEIIEKAAQARAKKDKEVA